MSNFTWRDYKLAKLLEDVLKQECDCCWAISIIRQLMALFRLERGFLDALSIQYLINGIARRQITEKGGLIVVEDAGSFLINEGTVLEKVCPLTYKVPEIAELLPDETKYRVSSFSVRTPADYQQNEWDFENDMEACLRRSPIAACIPSYASFNNLSDKVYSPTNAERDDFRFGLKTFSYHFMLLTGCGIDENGVHFWEFQDSSGVLCGDQGFIRIARHMAIVLCFVSIELVPEYLSDMDIDLSDMEIEM